MPAQVTNYQCPSCTGPLHFVGASGKLECDYCGSSFNIAEIEVFSFNSRCDNTSLELKSISHNAGKLLREREEKPL